MFLSLSHRYVYKKEQYEALNWQEQHWVKQHFQRSKSAQPIKTLYRVS